MSSGADSFDMAGKIVNALVGAVVAVVFTFIPLSTVLGGAVAGYLQGEEGLSTGALAGLLASIPLLAIAFVVGSGVAAVPAPFTSLAGGALFGVALLFVLLYSVLPAAVGGWLGALLASD